MFAETTTSTIAHDDRRMFTRRPARVEVHASLARDGEPLHLELRDLSVGGVGAWTTKPIPAGEKLSFSFPPEGFNRGFNTRGKVVRCEPSAMGYRIGVQFDRLLGV